jgi:dTDP-glucose 4,6-dehydratase
MASNLNEPVNIGNPHDVDRPNGRTDHQDDRFEGRVCKPQDDPQVRKPDITIARTKLGCNRRSSSRMA